MKGRGEKPFDFRYLARKPSIKAVEIIANKKQIY
jgi:hypothetical protein